MIQITNRWQWAEDPYCPIDWSLIYSEQSVQGCDDDGTEREN